jgi:NlpC/P60 family
MTSLRCLFALGLIAVSSVIANAMDYIGKPDSLLVASTVSTPTQAVLPSTTIPEVSQPAAILQSGTVESSPKIEARIETPKADQLVAKSGTIVVPGSFLETLEEAEMDDSHEVENISLVTASEDVFIGSQERTVRDEICAKARMLKGISYRKGGNDIDGFDCSGFTSYVFALEDKKIPSSSKSQATFGRKIDLASCQPGDMIFFSHNGRSIAHVGIVTKNDGDRLLVIHSTSSRGIIEQDVLKSSYWSKRIMFARNVLDEN